MKNNNRFIYPSLLTIFFICMVIYSINKMLLINVNPGSYFVILIGLIYLGFGIYSYLQQPYTKVMKHYLFLMFVAALAISLSVPSSEGIPLAREVEVITVSFAPYALLHFFQYFPYTKRPNIFSIIRYSSLIIAAVGAVMYFASLYIELPIINNIVRFSVIINILISVITCAVLLIQHLKFNSEKIRNQISVLIYGVFFSFVPVLLFSLIPEYILFLPGVPFYYSLISVIILPITISYLFSKHDMIQFNINVKKVSYYVVLFAICSVLFYVSSDKILHISINKTVYLNLLFLFGLIVFFVGQKFMDALHRQSWQSKNLEHQTEKQLISHQFFKTKHLEYCANVISDFIKKMFEIDSVSIIWKQNNIPVTLSSTGIFKTIESTELLNEINKNTDKNMFIYQEQTFWIHPLKLNDDTMGWILLRPNNKNTDLENLQQIEPFLVDAANLISSAQTLTSLKKQLQKNQELFQISDKFSHVLLNELENKDKKISQYLHDEVLQCLVLLSNQIDILHKKNQIDANVNDELKGYLKNVIHDIREMSHHLHPVIVEDLGLEPALSSIKRKLQENHNVTIELNNELSDYRVLTKELSVQIYSIIKELLHNAIKHSTSKYISVSIQEINHLIKIVVEDNGVGFDVQKYFSRLADSKSLGLITIQKRVNHLQGVFEINSKPNFGTSIKITLPIEWRESHDNQSIIS